MYNKTTFFKKLDSKECVRERLKTNSVVLFQQYLIFSLKIGAAPRCSMLQTALTETA
jgi:hypothetical protein